MVSTARLGKVTGWLIILGPVVDIAMVLLEPGNFMTDHPDGATQAMIESVQDVAANSGAAHLAGRDRSVRIPCLRAGMLRGRAFAP